jgi:hypothetical protein
MRGEAFASLPLAPNPFLQLASGQIFKDDVNGFSFSDIAFMAVLEMTFWTLIWFCKSPELYNVYI